jgi:ATP-dependent DNA helicase RecQ
MSSEKLQPVDCAQVSNHSRQHQASHSPEPSAAGQLKSGPIRCNSVLDVGEVSLPTEGGWPTERLQELKMLLQKYWGYSEFRPFQIESISACLAHRDSLTILPTGAGKSICFQLPALAMEGTALVVSPLIALMKDQVDALQRKGIAAAFVNSSLTSRERDKVIAQMSEGKLKLLYIAPERLMLESTLRYLSQQKISFIAIDEAHCISGWGHDFRPDYRKLGELRLRLKDLPIHCFTATASPRVREDIVVQLKLRDVQKLVADMDRPNLLYRMIPAIHRIDQICQIIDHYPKQSGIVFCLSRKDTERFAADLRHRGYNAAAYHAGFDMQERRRVQERFLSGQIDVIVATIAFGMGIDKSDIRYVIHNSLPQSVEHYVQEIGRAGRDGLPSECVILYRSADRSKRISLADSETRERADLVRNEIHHMANFAAGRGCRRKTLLATMGQSFKYSNCGACDNCLKHVPELQESESVILSLLSFVKERGENYGSKYIRGVARNAASPLQTDKAYSSPALQENGDLSRFSDIELEDYIEQILSLGLLASSGSYGILKLTPSGRKTLRDGKCHLRLLNRFSKPSPIQLGNWRPAEDCDKDLFQICLKKLACPIPSVQSLPKSFAWHLASYRPTAPHTLRDWLKEHQVDHSWNLVEDSDMADHSNLESVDSDNWLQRICSWMQDYCHKNALSTNQNRWAEFLTSLPHENEVADQMKRLRLNSAAVRNFPFFDAAKSISEIHFITGLSESTISVHLCNYIEARNLSDCSTWVPHPAIAAIEAAITLTGNERLRPIFEHLESKYSYNEIRIVSACYNEKQRSKSLLSVAE